MFERNKIGSVEHGGVPVELTMHDGEVIAGKMIMSAGRNFGDVLNGPGTFVELEPWGGDRVFIAKASLRNIKQVQVPKPENLKARVQALDGFDPHGVLGVPARADLAAVKAAWHKLAKAYHPDRYANAELPPEVTDYLSAMARRINGAYAALETQLGRSRQYAQIRQAPMHETRVQT